MVLKYWFWRFNNYIVYIDGTPAILPISICVLSYNSVG